MEPLSQCETCVSGTMLIDDKCTHVKQGDWGYCWTEEATNQELCVCEPGYYGISCNIEGVYYASGVMAGLLVVGILLVFSALRV